jgi:hypothetical protein
MSSLSALEKYLSNNQEDDIYPPFNLSTPFLDGKGEITTKSSSLHVRPVAYDMTMNAAHLRQRTDDRAVETFLVKMKSVQSHRKKQFENLKQRVNIELELDDFEHTSFSTDDDDDLIDSVDDIAEIDESNIHPLVSSGPLGEQSIHVYKSRKELRTFSRINDLELLRAEFNTGNTNDVQMMISSSLRHLDVTLGEDASTRFVDYSRHTHSGASKLDNLLGLEVSEVQMQPEEPEEKESPLLSTTNNQELVNSISLQSSRPASPVQIPSPGKTISQNLEIRARSPDIKPHSPEVKVRSTEGRSRSPEVKVYCSDLRSLSPEVKVRSTDRRSVSPEIRVYSSDMRSRSPEIKERSPDRRSRSPEVKVYSSDMRSRSPTMKVRTPDRRSVSPEIRVYSSDMSSRSPEMKVRSPDRRSVSPEIRVYSSDMRSRSPEMKVRSPDRRSVSPEVKAYSLDLRSRFQITHNSGVRTNTLGSLVSDHGRSINNANGERKTSNIEVRILNTHPRSVSNSRRESSPGKRINEMANSALYQPPYESVSENKRSVSFLNPGRSSVSYEDAPALPRLNPSRRSLLTHSTVSPRSAGDAIRFNSFVEQEKHRPQYQLHRDESRPKTDAQILLARAKELTSRVYSAWDSRESIPSRTQKALNINHNSGNNAVLGSRELEEWRRRSKLHTPTSYVRGFGGGNELYVSDDDPEVEVI